MKSIFEQLGDTYHEEDGLEWTGRMNHIRACAREIVNNEIIFV